MSAGPDRTVLHASAILVGDVGVLIRGPSGVGKSRLAREVIQLAPLTGAAATLVADDRVELSAADGRLLARPVPSIVGLLEARGVGIARVPFTPEAEIRLVADIATEPPPRLPVRADQTVRILDTEVSRIVVYGEGKSLLLLWRLGIGDDALMTDD